jgi:hypothetical protein
MNECMDGPVDGGMDLCCTEQDVIATLSIVEWNGCEKELCGKAGFILFDFAGQHPHQNRNRRVDMSPLPASKAAIGAR